MRSVLARVPLLMALLGLPFPTPALAGPNGGGVLIVHDTGYSFTYWQQLPPPPTPAPATCAETDNIIPCPMGAGVQRVFRVYAAFPGGSSPRLKALSFGCDVSGTAYVYFWGLPDPAHDFEVTQDGWPSTAGGGAGVSFGTVKTALINEVYWLGGYSYACDGLWSTAPHPVQASVFADDGVPPHIDPICAFGSIGFGIPGTTYCPSEIAGACCLTDYSCMVLSIPGCIAQGGVPWGMDVPCDPDPCPPAPDGACCFPDGSCEVLPPGECAEAGSCIYFPGDACQPDPCPPVPWPGACCFWNGTCSVLVESECEAQQGTWLGICTTCEPNPCPPAIGACCFADGSCQLRAEAICLEYGGEWLGPGIYCVPNPCPQMTGACCFPDGTCQELLGESCAGAGGMWLGPETGCDPNPCDSTPVETTTWGRVKDRYR